MPSVTRTVALSFGCIGGLASHVVTTEPFLERETTSLLQSASTPVAAAVAERRSEPFLIGLRRESVPIYRQGKIASYKTSYSGVLNVGSPPQEFRVVFDTGSGNIVLPASECKSEACLVEDRRRFNMSASSTAVAINQNGSPVPEGETCDQVTIGFGTGEITGEYTRDIVCFGSPPEMMAGNVMEENSSVPAMVPKTRQELCVEMSVILAVEMSTQPFKTFRFDGILGLGLDGLAMNRHFSAFEMIMGTGLPHPHFGVFLAENEEGEESEIAMGGVDEKRILEPLHWASVAMPEFGYWQVRIKAVRVNGKELDVCKDGTCRGVVDTGTSHLGVPAPHDAELADLLTVNAGDTLDCRLIEAPELEIEIEGYNLTLHSGNYMRRLPLREGISVSSKQGVYLPSSETNKTLESRSSADAVPVVSNQTEVNGNETAVSANATGLSNVTANATSNASSLPAMGNSTGENSTAEQDQEVRRFCRPRMMPVRLPAPVGPKLFILGEPVLHRYYTVYDWANRRVGFSLANNRRNNMDPAELKDRRGVLPEEVDMLLMQERVAVSKRPAAVPQDNDEIVAMVQVSLKVSVRSRRI